MAQICEVIHTAWLELSSILHKAGKQQYLAVQFTENALINEMLYITAQICVRLYYISLKDYIQ